MEALKPHERISAALASAADEGRVGLVPYITAGYPDKDGFIETLRKIASVADVVEIGVPFSDPMADGVTIQRASHHAIANGVSLRWILTTLESAGQTARSIFPISSCGRPSVTFSQVTPASTDL